MKRKTLLLAALTTVVSAMTSPARAEDAAAGASNAFGCDLYGALREKDGNLVFSPASISLALAMTRLGAGGTTATEFDRTLHLGSVAGVHTAFGALQSAWLEQTGDATLHVANRLFGERSSHFRSEFLTACRESYAAELEPMDFRHAAEDSRRHINAWVAEQTADMIDELLPAGVITSNTALVLANAIYFLADWARAFDPEATRQQPFTLTDGKEVEAALMHQQGQFGFAAQDGLQILTLPYAGDELAFVVLLPDDPGGIADVESRLTPENLSTWLAAATPREVRVALPSFNLESDFDLNATLARLGIVAAFTPGRADFSPMNGKRDLFISNVIHQAVIELDEQGTEAAAATAVVMKRTSVAPPPPAFTADHPFVFLIHHRQTGAILFMGRVLDPR